MPGSHACRTGTIGFDGQRPRSREPIVDCSSQSDPSGRRDRSRAPLVLAELQQASRAEATTSSRDSTSLDLTYPTTSPACEARRICRRLGENLKRCRRGSGHRPVRGDGSSAIARPESFASPGHCASESSTGRPSRRSPLRLSGAEAHERISVISMPEPRRIPAAAGFPPAHSLRRRRLRCDTSGHRLPERRSGSRKSRPADYDCAQSLVRPRRSIGYDAACSGSG